MSVPSEVVEPLERGGFPRWTDHSKPKKRIDSDGNLSYEILSLRAFALSIRFHPRHIPKTLEAAMTKHVAGQWALKLLRLTLVFLLIAGTVDLLVVTLRSLIDRVSWTSRPAGEVLREPVSEHLIKLPDTGSPGDSVPYRDLKDAGSLADKKLLLHIRPDGLTARYEISLNRNHPLLELIQSGLPAGDMSGFIKETMGEILVLGQSLEFEPAQVIVLPNEPLARVVTDSRKFDPASQDYQIFLRSPRVLLPIEATGTEVVFETEQAAVWSRTELLASKTAERTVFVLPPDRGDFSCGITMSQWTPREKIAAKPLADLINRGFTPLPASALLGQTAPIQTGPTGFRME